MRSGLELDRPANDRSAGSPAGGERAGFEPLCIETQSREIMSVLVHDVVAEAFRLNLPGAPPAPISKANGAPLARRTQVTNG